MKWSIRWWAQDGLGVEAKPHTEEKKFATRLEATNAAETFGREHANVVCWEVFNEVEEG